MKNILFFTLLATTCIFSAGCDKKKSDPDVKPSGQKPGSPPRPRLVIRYPDALLQAGHWREALEQFQSQNSNVQVVAEAVPGSAAEQLNAYTAKFEERATDFDLFLCHVDWIGKFASRGWLRDLQNIVPVNERTEFFAGAVEAANWERRLYAVPYFIDGTVLYARGDLLQKAGATLPRTWADVARIATEYKQKNPNVPMFGLLWPGQPADEFVDTILEFLWANDGELFHYNKVVASTPQNRTTLNFVQGLIQRYKITPPFVTNANPESLRQLFLEGKALFLRDWASQRTVLRTNQDVVLTALPGFAGHSPASSLDGWFLGINSRTRYVDASAQLLQHLMTAPAMTSLVRSSGQMPARPNLYKDPETLRTHPDLESLDKSLVQMHAFPVLSDGQPLRSLLAHEFGEFLAGRKTADEVVATLQAQILILVNPQNAPPPQAGRRAAPSKVSLEG